MIFAKTHHRIEKEDIVLILDNKGPIMAEKK